MRVSYVFGAGLVVSLLIAQACGGPSGTPPGCGVDPECACSDEEGCTSQGGSPAEPGPEAGGAAGDDSPEPPGESGSPGSEMQGGSPAAQGGTSGSGTSGAPNPERGGAPASGGIEGGGMNGSSGAGTGASPAGGAPSGGADGSSGSSDEADGGSPTGEGGAGSGGEPSCTPGSTFCQDEAVVDCSEDGNSTSVVQLCGSQEFCDDEAVECTPWICEPSQPTCGSDPTLVYACLADGSGVEATGTPCEAGQTCYSGECVSGIVDEVGIEARIRAEQNCAGINFYQVSAARYLVQIEAYIELPADQSVVFMVYESDTTTRTDYALVFDVEVAASTSDGYLASPELELPLAAGKYYAIGIKPVSASQYIHDIGNDVTLPDDVLSFGTRIGSTNYCDDQVADPTVPPEPMPLGMAKDFVYRQRLTTREP